MTHWTHCPPVKGSHQGVAAGPRAGGLAFVPLCECKVRPERRTAGSSAQNGSALQRELSGGSRSAKRQPLPSPSEGSLSSGGMDQGSDAPARDCDGEVSAHAAASRDKGVAKSCVRDSRAHCQPGWEAGQSPGRRSPTAPGCSGFPWLS